MTSARSTRRDQLLQQLGITQYQLTKPAVLRGEVELSLPINCRLIVIAPANFDMQSMFFQDILRSMSLILEQILLIVPEQAAMLHDIQQYAVLTIAVPDEALSLPENVCTLHCPDFNQISQDASAKRLLWQQICQYEHYFFTAAR